MIASVLENIRVALIGLRSNKLRAALTMLGITIGVAAVIVLVSIGQAVDNFVRGQFAGLGTNLVIVFPDDNSRGQTVRLTLNEARALGSLLPAAGSDDAGELSPAATLPLSAVVRALVRHADPAAADFLLARVGRARISEVALIGSGCPATRSPP